MTAPCPEALARYRVAGELIEARRFADAAPHLERSVELEPSWVEPYRDLAIAYKHGGDFPRSLWAAEKALELQEGASEGMLWNLGIAATALSEWTRARWAWTQLGIPIPGGSGPIEMNLGATPIRINVHHHPEVVWCYRIDPARARIESVPTPRSSRRYRDILLHDGEPRGEREIGGQTVAVFDELAVLESSSYRTWEVEVTAPGEDDLRDLFQALEACPNTEIEDWSSNVRQLCKECSEGRPDHHHPPEHTPDWMPIRRLGVAALNDEPLRIVTQWAERRSGRAADIPVLAPPNEGPP